MVAHTGEMRFSCEQCPKKFRLKQHLEMHLDAHDGGQFVSNSEASATSMEKKNMQEESSKQPSEDFQKESSEMVERNNNAEPSPADVKDHMNRCQSSDKNDNLLGCLAAAATNLEDEVVVDQGTYSKRKPKKVISTKDSTSSM